MKSSAMLAASLMLLATPAISADAATPSARVTLGDITDTRTTGQFFAGLKVELKLSGDAVFDAYGIGKPVFTIAKDDTGRSLIKEDKRESLLWEMQPRREKSANETVSGELTNPSRKATSISMQGTVPVYAPSLDPASVVNIPDITTAYGKPMTTTQPEFTLTVLDKTSAEAFSKAREDKKKADAAAAGNMVNSAFGQMFGLGGGMQPNDIQFRVKDPAGFLVRIEVIGADGKPLDTSSRSKFTSDGEDVYTYSFHQPLAKGTGLRLYYGTAKSLQQVPFSIENQPLP